MRRRRAGCIQNPAMRNATRKERRLRRLIVRTCEALYAKNMVAATDGNISARLGPDKVLITPSNSSKGAVRSGDLLVCDLKGRPLSGRGRPSVEVHLHLAAYRQRRDIGGVVHAHPPMVSAFTVAGREEWLNEPILPEVVAHLGRIPAVPYFTPGSRVLADALELEIRNHDVVLLLQHGAVAVAKDPWAAYLLMEKLEHFAMIVKAARELAGAGKMRRLNAREVRELRPPGQAGRRPAPQGSEEGVAKPCRF